MKRLTCEICGSTDLVKDGGVFVCQACGCKYSVEEARKMMIEGVVEVTGSVEVAGTVKVDNSSFVEKYLANARRAKAKEDWEETEKYYNMVEQNDPDNIEAIFYSAYGKAKASLVDQDIYRRKAVFKVLKNCISVIDDHYKPERREENKQAILAMADDLGKMICSTFVFTKWTNGYGIVTRTNAHETYGLFGSLLDGFKESLDNIQKVDDQPYLHEALIRLCETAKNVSWENQYGMQTLLNRWIAEEQQELNALKQKAMQVYWTEHAEEYRQLSDEREALEQKIRMLMNEISALPAAKAVSNYQQQIEERRQAIARLGLFQSSEKTQIQQQINSLNALLAEAVAAMNAAAEPRAQQMSEMKARIAEIGKTLTDIPW